MFFTLEDENKMKTMYGQVSRNQKDLAQINNELKQVQLFLDKVNKIESKLNFIADVLGYEDNETRKEKADKKFKHGEEYYWPALFTVGHSFFGERKNRKLGLIDALLKHLGVEFKEEEVSSSEPKLVRQKKTTKKKTLKKSK